MAVLHHRTVGKKSGPPKLAGAPPCRVREQAGALTPDRLPAPLLGPPWPAVVRCAAKKKKREESAIEKKKRIRRGSRSQAIGRSSRTLRREPPAAPPPDPARES